MKVVHVHISDRKTVVRREFARVAETNCIRVQPSPNYTLPVLEENGSQLGFMRVLRKRAHKALRNVFGG